MPPNITGSIPFKVGTEIYETWYKVYGDLKNGQHHPIVALHGGPGMSHHYMLPNKTIFTEGGKPVVFYDQIGNGASSLCPGVPREFWTPKLFMDELDNLLKALDIYDAFDIIGQSWGGMLAAQYAATRQPKGLKRLILSNTTASIPLFNIGINALLEQFPEDFVKMIRKHEAEGTTDSQEYQEAALVFDKKHVCTVVPWPEDLATSSDLYEQNPTVYRTMWGPSEFAPSGSLRDWTIVDILHQILCPTLLISARLDEMQEVAVLPFFQKIPKIKWVELQNSTHLGQFEEPERYFQVVLDFLQKTIAA